MNAQPLQELFNDVVNEMARIADPDTGYEELFAGALPRLIATSSGAPLQVTERLDDLIADVAFRLYANSPHTKTHSQEEYLKVVRAAFGDPLVSLNWDWENDELAKKLSDEVRSQVSNSFGNSVREYAFSCSLFEEGSFEPFSIGPTTFSSRQAWLDRSVEKGFLSVNTFKRACGWLKSVEPEELEELAPYEELYENELRDLLLRPRRNICSVEVCSLGPKTQQSRAVEAANLAITTLSLFMPSASQFHRSAFLSYDTVPRRKTAMSFIRDHAILPGSSITHHPAPPLDAEQFSKFLHENRAELGVAGNALRDGTMPDGQFAKRQVSRSLKAALTWFRRGCIEDDDRVAIIFLSSSLDALCKKGKAKEITELVCQTLGKEKTESPWNGAPPIHILVKDIYDDGRSRLIHGTSEKVNRDWGPLRVNAEQVAKFCLLGALIYFAKHPNCDKLEALLRSN